MLLINTNNSRPSYENAIYSKTGISNEEYAYKYIT